MNRKLAGLTAGTATALVLGLTACGSDGSSGVSGNLDDVKHVKAVAAKTKTKTVNKTKEKCTKRNKNGTCRTKVTVPDGTKQVTETVKPGKPARYCVELDNVNGDTNRDDVWYRVDSDTYFEWSEKTEGTKVKDMAYSREGC